MIRFLRRRYHEFMVWYWGWRIRCYLAKFRKIGKEHGLPSLDAWTDEQIIAGMKETMKLKEGNGK